MDWKQGRNVYGSEGEDARGKEWWRKPRKGFGFSHHTAYRSSSGFFFFLSLCTSKFSRPFAASPLSLSPRACLSGSIWGSFQHSRRLQHVIGRQSGGNQSGPHCARSRSYRSGLPKRKKRKEKKPLTIKGYCRTLHRRDIFRRTTRPPSRLMRSFVRRPYAFSLIGEPQRKKMANRAEPSTLSQTTVYSYEQLEPGRPVLKRNTSTENKREARKDEQTLPRNCFNMPRSIWHTQAGAFA